MCNEMRVSPEEQLFCLGVDESVIEPISIATDHIKITHKGLDAQKIRNLIIETWSSY